MVDGEDAVSVDLSLTIFFVFVVVVLLCFVFFFHERKDVEGLNSISPRFHVVNQ